MHLDGHFKDFEILEILKTGTNRDVDAVIGFLYRNYASFLAIYVQENGGNEQDADDLFQDVLLQFISSVRENKFRGDAAIKTFLYSINRNLWFNEMKKRDRSKVRELKYEKGQDQEVADAQETISQLESRKQIIDVVEQLGPDCKKILLAYYYENLSMREILELTDYDSEQVVRNKKYKCLKNLEQLLHQNPNLANQLKTVLQYES